MSAERVKLLNASQLRGKNLVGRRIMVDENHKDWFETAAQGSDLSVSEVFRVKAVEWFGPNTVYLNFERAIPVQGAPYYGPYAGCGEDHRFLVVDAPALVIG